MTKLAIITLRQPGLTDFAKARNELVKKSKADWLFFVDSDETVSGELEREIVDRIQDTNFDGFYVYRKNYFLGRYIGTDKILRVIKKDSGSWERVVHEIFVPNKSHHAGEIGSPLIHNTAKSLNEYVAKINLYARLHAKANKAEGKKSNLLKIIFFPKLKFMQSILTGRGVVFSILQAFHSFLAWSELWLTQRN